MLLDLLYHHSLNTECAWGESWGIAWGDSWGTSWGDIPVDELWDTSQGIARNKNTLLKFQPIQDIEQRIGEAQAVSSVGGLTPVGEAQAEFFGVSAAFSHGGFLARVQANAFATFKSYSSVGAVGEFTPCADSFASGVSVGGASGVGEFDPYGESMATFDSVVNTITSQMNIQPRGIRNPTDEELGALVVNHLLTRKQNYRRLVA